MRKLFVLLLFFLSFIAFSQTNVRTIVVRDVDTDLPIEDAMVLILKTKQVLMSNADGTVVFEVNGGSNLQVTHSSYLSITIRWSALKQNENIVYLKSKVNMLDEIVFTKEKPQKVLQSLVENSKKKLNVPARLKVYSREFFKLNGDYAYYNDGLINFLLYRDQKKLKATLLVEQNRSYGLLEEEISSDLLGYDLNIMMENYYVFKCLNPLLDEKVMKGYSFVIKSCPTNEEYNEIMAIPLDDSHGLLDDFKIVYDVKRNLIIEIDAVISPATLSRIKEKTGNGSKNITKSVFKTCYRVTAANYYLVSSKEEIGFESVVGNQTKNIEVLNNLVTTSFNYQNFTYKENQVFKDKTLFNKKNSILTNYWDVSGLTPTTKELEIINKIKY